MAHFDNPLMGAPSAINFQNWDFGKYNSLFNDVNPGNGSIMGPLNTSTPVAGKTPSFWDKFIGTKETGPGWGNLTLGGLQGIGNFYLGSKQLKLAEQSLAENKSQFAKQFGIQKQEINRAIRDKGQARYDRNPHLNPTPDEYYETNKIV